MESDDLVAQDVRALDQGGWNGDSPGVVVCDEGVGSPGTGFKSVLYRKGQGIKLTQVQDCH